MQRKYIRPRSVRIYGLPGTDDRYGLRDNGCGQMRSEDRRVGSINYWTGDVVLAKEYVPHVRFWHSVRIMLGLGSETLNVRYEYECHYRVSLLETEAVRKLDGLSLTGDVPLTGRRLKI